MTEVGFYHLTTRPLEQVLPRLLEKVLEAGHRVIVRSADAAQLKRLDELLWTYEESSFLPHGQESAGFKELQPILLTSSQDNPNGADVLVVADSALPEQFDGFSRVLYMFEAEDPERLTLARRHWTSLKDREGVTRTYWQQDERGRWEKKQ